MMGTVPLVAWLVACKHRDVVFPSTLDPLEANRAEWPDPDSEALSLVSGGDSDLWWAHSRGYVRAPFADVWDALDDTEVVVDRREVDTWDIERGVLPEFERSWVIHNVVDDIITVDYDLTWAFELQAPEHVVARWDKTDGTTFIDTLRGTLEIDVHPDDPQVTRISAIEHLKASLRDDETIAQYLRDLHGSILARTHGEPLPTY